MVNKKKRKFSYGQIYQDRDVFDPWSKIIKIYL